MRHRGEHVFYPHRAIVYGRPNNITDYNFADFLSADCPNHVTSGVMTDDKYDYQMVNMAGWDNYALLDIMACREAHVALADQADVHNANVYEILIGGYQNTRYAVRSVAQFSIVRHNL